MRDHGGLFGGYDRFFGSGLIYIAVFGQPLHIQNWKVCAYLYRNNVIFVCCGMCALLCCLRARTLMIAAHFSLLKAMRFTVPSLPQKANGL